MRRALTQSLRQTVCALLLVAAMCCLGGCSSSSGGGAWSLRGDAIQELHLLVMPAALRFTQPGLPEGFVVRVFATSRGSAKGVPLRTGTLEILAYDGIPNEAGMQTAKPAQVVWAYPAASLAPYATSSSLGTGYELTLPWKGPRPTNSRVTLVARYNPTSGPVLLAAPSVIPNAMR